MLRWAGFLCVGLATSLGVAGCGSSGSGCAAASALFPEKATLDHAAPAPENQTSYGIGEKVLQGNCGVPAHLVGVQSLTVSDPKNVQVGTNGFVAVVTCLAPTSGPVTVTSGTLTAELTCR